MKVLAWVEKAGAKVVDVVEDIPAAAVTVEKLLADGQKVAPEVKTAITLLVHDAEQLVLAGGPMVLSKGTDLLADAATAAAAKKLIGDFITVLPTLESAGKVLFADVQQGIAAAPAK